MSDFDGQVMLFLVVCGFSVALAIIGGAIWLTDTVLERFFGWWSEENNGEETQERSADD